MLLSQLIDRGLTYPYLNSIYSGKGYFHYDFIKEFIHNIFRSQERIVNYNFVNTMRKNKARNDPDIKLSKALSWLLRHGATSENVRITSEGYVRMSDVLDYLAQEKGYNTIKAQHILHIVDSNDKKRFEVKEDIDEEAEEKVLWIRAVQGHSINAVKTEDLLERIEDPEEYPVVVHGTYDKFWPLIEKQGLKRMGRLHIHFAPGYPKDQSVISGMRGSCDTLIEVDLEAAMKDGISFFVSSNNVVLTEGIDGVLPPKYFKKVTKREN